MKYYNVKEVATLLEVNEETVRRWIREGKLNAERGSGRQGSKISSDDLKKLLNENAALMTSAVAQSLSSLNGLVSTMPGTIAAAGALIGGSAPLGMAAGYLIGKSWLNIISQKDTNKEEVKMELMNEELELEQSIMFLKNEILTLQNQVSIKQNELELLENQLSKLKDYTSKE